jgi:hypothetical protein
VKRLKKGGVSSVVVLDFWGKRRQRLLIKAIKKLSTTIIDV